MKSLSALGLIAGIFLMLLALGIWSASHRPLRTGQVWQAPPPAVMADARQQPASPR